MKKLCHLHLQGGFGGKSTLICWLKNGCITYVFYGGWASSGTPYALSNLQCSLPVDLESEDETVDQFVSRVVKIINTKSVERVIERVNCNITFKA